MAQVLHLNAFEMLQPLAKNKAMYTTTIPVKYLIDDTYFVINWWDKDKMGKEDQGYQRRPENESRKKRIAKYIKSGINPIFPTNIVIVSREKLIYKKDHKNIGTLELNGYPLFVLDGQNRIEGFRYSIDVEGITDVLEYEMPVTILSGFELIDEVEQFYILNSEQKKVKTDLAQRLRRELHLEMGEKRYMDLYGDNWENRALPVLDLLNNTDKKSPLPENVWFERIIEANEKKGLTKLVSQNSFLASLRPLFKNGVFEGILPDVAFRSLYSYWAAVEKCFPDAFITPREYVIQRTAGVFSLHMLANAVFKRLSSEHREWNEENIHELLTKAFRNNYDANFWMSNSKQGATLYGSMKGFRMLADHFIANMNR